MPHVVTVPELLDAPAVFEQIGTRFRQAVARFAELRISGGQREHSSVYRGGSGLRGELCAP